MRPSQPVDNQLLDEIQWSEPEADALAYRYPMLDREVQTGARLAVRESETALFVDEGRAADIFGPGMYALNAGKLPVLARAKNWGNGFAAPFRADVYFFSMQQVTGQKWGTAMTGLPGAQGKDRASVRAYGSYGYRVADVRRFFTGVSGTRESFLAYDLDDRLRKIIVARMMDALSSHEMLPGELRGGALEAAVRPLFAALGLELTEFSVEGVEFQDQALVGMRNMDESMAEPSSECVSCGAAMRAEHGVWKCDYCHAVVGADAGGDDVEASVDACGPACPACKIALMQATVGGASLLYCTRCDGMLVAMEEFEALVAAARALRGRAMVADADVRDTYDCPGCGRSMGVSFHGGHVAVDSCEDCAFFWLDHGELSRIAYAPAEDVHAPGTYVAAAHRGSQAGSSMNV